MTDIVPGDIVTFKEKPQLETYFVVALKRDDHDHHAHTIVLFDKERFYTARILLGWAHRVNKR